MEQGELKGGGVGRNDYPAVSFSRDHLGDRGQNSPGPDQDSRGAEAAPPGK